MTLLSVVKDVCAVVGVKIPQSLFSGIATDRTQQEMLSLANEMAQRIAYDYRDWTRLRTISLTATVGNGSNMPMFPLPDNYKRMLLTSNVWRSSDTMNPLSFVPDTDVWINRRNRGHLSHPGEWTIIGGDIYISPPLVLGESAYFPYLDKNCIKLAGGGVNDVFLSDLDTFRLDERLLKLGMIWQWQANKGASYAEAMGTFGDAMGVAMGHDSPAPILVDRPPRMGDYRAQL